MYIKMIKMSMAGLLLCLSSIANAVVIYEYVCDSASCGNSFGGSLTVSDIALLSGTASGTDIIEFEFSTDAGGGAVWSLDEVAGGVLKVVFSVDGSVLTQVSRIESWSTDVEFTDTVTGGTLGVSHEHVYGYYYDQGTFATIDYGGAAGSWQRVVAASVPEPSTLAIFSLGLIGLATRRFKKQS